MSPRRPEIDVAWDGDHAVLWVNNDDSTTAEVAEKSDGTWAAVVYDRSGVEWETQAPTRQEAVDKVGKYWHDLIWGQYEAAAEAGADEGWW